MVETGKEQIALPDVNSSLLSLQRRLNHTFTAYRQHTACIQHNACNNQQYDTLIDTVLSIVINRVCVCAWGTGPRPAVWVPPIYGLVAEFPVGF
jgi:hypothetical protein